MERHVQYNCICIFPSLIFGSVLTNNCFNIKPRDSWQRLFSCSFFLSSSTLSSGCRSNLEMDSTSRWYFKRFFGLTWNEQNIIFCKSRMGDVLGSLCINLGSYGILHSYFISRSPGYSTRSLRGCRDGWNFKRTSFLAYYFAAIMA